MKDRPTDVDESELRDALSAWGIDAATLTHAPVGFGDHHWTADDDQGRRWFVTVADLADKPYCGIGTEAAAQGLNQAMDTAARLQLDFVVAPLCDADGQTVRRFGKRYGVSVFPYLDGRAGAFGQDLTSEQRDALIDLLAELHQAAPPATAPRHFPPAIPARADLDDALTLRSLRQPWAGGPYSEPARALLARHVSGLEEHLREFDARVQELARRSERLVVTHGEPHPGNVLWQDGRPLLLDWDTVGLALPERDLWLVADGPEHLARYAEATGRKVDPSALDLYRLRWDFDDIASAVRVFRAPHTRSPDTQVSWDCLAPTLKHLTNVDERDGG